MLGPPRKKPEPTCPQIFGDYPNIVGNFIAFSSGVGSFYETSENKGNTMPSTSPDTPRHNRIIFDASRSSALYKNNLAEIRVNALFGLNLIKAF